MKSPEFSRKTRLAATLAGIGTAVCMFLITPAQAATFYWDGDGTGAAGSGNTVSGVGGSGTWNTTSSNWWTGSAYQAWANVGGAAGSVANLNGAGGTVTIDSGGITAGVDSSSSGGGVFFKTTGYTLAGGPINFDTTGAVSSSVLYNLATGTTTINSDTVIKTYATGAAATLRFAYTTGTNVYLTVNGGIKLASSETAGVKTLEFVGRGPNTTYVINGAISEYVNATSTAKIKLQMSDFAYNQTLVLSASNNYSGGTWVRKGSLIAINDNAAGSGTVTFVGAGSAAFLTGTSGLTIANAFSWQNDANSISMAIGGTSTGVSTYTGNFTSANQLASAPLVFTAALGGTVNFNGNIKDNNAGGTVLSVVKTGKGVVSLSGSSYYNTSTNITEGTLLVNNPTYSVTGSGAVYVNRASAVTGVAGSMVAQSGTYTVASTAGLVVGQSVTSSVLPAGTYVAAILNSTTVLLSSVPNAATGACTLDFGSSAGTLGGKGIVAGAVSVADGAAIAPGNFDAGTLTLQNGLTLQGTYEWEIGANSDSTGFDKIVLTGGGLTLGATSVLDISALAGVDFSNIFWSANHSWTIIENTGSGLISNTFGSLSGLTGNEYGAFSVTYDSAAGGDVTLNWSAAVPEPSTWAMLGLGLGILSVRFHLRNRRWVA